MKIDDLQKAQDLILKVNEFIAQQNAGIAELHDSLNQYVAFMQEQIKELRDGEPK